MPYFSPYSCDLNPIENIWSILKNIEELKTMIREEWNKLDQSVIRRSIKKNEESI